MSRAFPLKHARYRPRWSWEFIPKRGVVLIEFEADHEEFTRDRYTLERVVMPHSTDSSEKYYFRHKRLDEETKRWGHVGGCYILMVPPRTILDELDHHWLSSWLVQLKPPKE